MSRIAELCVEVEELLDQNLMPGFEALSKSAPLSGRKGGASTTPTKTDTSATARAELQDMREQADAWKVRHCLVWGVSFSAQRSRQTSYLHAKEQLTKSEKAFQKMLESYHKDEEKIAELTAKLRDAKKTPSKVGAPAPRLRAGSSRNDGSPPMAASATGAGPEVSAPIFTRRIEVGAVVVCFVRRVR